MEKRAALMVTGVNFLLTLIKFLLYYFTGSLVILAESWHSLTDILTSLLVTIALIMAEKAKRRVDSNGGQGEQGSAVGGTESVAGGWTMEMKVSLGIGLVLLIVSMELIRLVIWSRPTVINNPLPAGFVFLGFAVASFMISRFETNFGQRCQSIGLVADGMHSRADMVASLIAGFSLLLMGMGINIDRWAALAISLFILSFSIEVIGNVILMRYRDRTQKVFVLRSDRFISVLVDPTQWPRITRFLRERHWISDGMTAWIGLGGRFVAGISVLGAVLLFFSTCFFAVGPTQRAVLLRFGKTVVSHDFPPGIHLKLPWPIDRVMGKETTIQSLPVGNITDNQTVALLWTRTHGTEEAFLSGDNYFMYPYVIIHYRIVDLYAYLFTYESPEAFLSSAANQLCSRIFSTTTFYELVTTYRQRLSEEMLESLQALMVGSGLEVISVNVKDIHPPVAIADSFEQVVAAIQEKQQLINEAHGAQNKRLPEIRGESARSFEAAKSYVTEKKAAAIGETQRFDLRRQIFSRHQAIISKHFYLSSLQTALTDCTKIIYDSKAGTPALWMNDAKTDITFPEIGEE